MDHIKALRETARRLPWIGGLFYAGQSGEIIYVGKKSICAPGEQLFSQHP